MNGTPGNEAPIKETSSPSNGYFKVCMCQYEGIAFFKWGSEDKIGLPDFVWLPWMTQQFDPIAPSSPGIGLTNFFWILSVLNG
jgi:hypothetical protein